MSGLNKGLGRVEVALKWDPSPAGAPDHDLDIIAATYPAHDPYGKPAYLVHFGSRSPDGTITLNRDSRTGQGFGDDEVMVLEFDRLSPSYGRVVVGVAIQQREGHKTFGAVPHTGIRISEGRAELLTGDFAGVSDCTAATVAEFVRDDAGAWQFRAAVRGFDTDPASFAAEMGRRRAS
ncbi:TerD family protein [Streptomyces sp. ISL-11]|uniref:TerD family protein n=1 Tax=Streptomyces sp. ISL-11 TaxID=2819174 RepID=UPI001BEB341D|nr:TerD family protein [Streptomyces sp. ISL-11]MBT2387744.1 TerD family protein [Streptomyces sp. ISL-11]